MTTYLTVLALTAGCCTIAGILLYLSEQAHRDLRATGRAAVPTRRPITVARHRAGQVNERPAGWNPLDSWVRQSIAPTANEQVALPAGPLEETCALRRPVRPDEPECTFAAGCRVHPDEDGLHNIDDAEVSQP